MAEFNEIRNFNGVQFAKLRIELDEKFNKAHDELSDCYYNKKPYYTYGVLDKATFDKLHGLIFLKRDVEFHNLNMTKETADKIPESEYNTIKNPDGTISTDTKSSLAETRIADLANEGITIDIKEVSIS